VVAALLYTGMRQEIRKLTRNLAADLELVVEKNTKIAELQAKLDKLETKIFGTWGASHVRQLEADKAKTSEEMNRLRQKAEQFMGEILAHKQTIRRLQEEQSMDSNHPELKRVRAECQRAIENLRVAHHQTVLGLEAQIVKMQPLQARYAHAEQEIRRLQVQLARCGAAQNPINQREIRALRDRCSAYENDIHTLQGNCMWYEQELGRLRAAGVAQGPANVEAIPKSEFIARFIRMFFKGADDKESFKKITTFFFGRQFDQTTSRKVIYRKLSLHVHPDQNHGQDSELMTEVAKFLNSLKD
jgi:chromosome segregation ATPase